MSIVVGTSSITFPDSTTQSTAASVSIPGIAVQIFTSSGTFTIPTGVTSLKVYVVGAGGGSGGCIKQTSECYSAAGGGGGSGGYALQFLSGLTPGNTLSVTIGSGGTAGPSTSGSGGTGGASSVASGTQSISTITANGGGGGSLGNNNSSGTGGAGGSASGGYFNFSGLKTGISGAASFLNPLTGGVPNNTYSSGGGVPGVAGSTSTYGCGAAGAANNSTSTNYAGAAGANGIVIFEW